MLLTFGKALDQIFGQGFDQGRGEGRIHEYMHAVMDAVCSTTRPNEKQCLKTHFQENLEKHKPENNKVR